eukprot:SAG11_NODE_14515_length_609_cov_1.172549_2_plen_50_part_01
MDKRVPDGSQMFWTSVLAIDEMPSPVQLPSSRFASRLKLFATGFVQPRTG